MPCPMFGLSLGHLIIVAVVVLLFGHRRLPELGSALGHTFAEAKVAGVANFEEARRELDRHPETDALLLDLDMPGMEGLTGLRSEEHTSELQSH